MRVPKHGCGLPLSVDFWLQHPRGQAHLQTRSELRVVDRIVALVLQQQRGGLLDNTALCRCMSRNAGI